MGITTGMARSRWAAIGAAVAVSLGAGGIGIGYATVSSGERAVYDPINPCRLADFRPGSQVGPRGTPLGPDGVHTLDGWGVTGDCNLPSGTSGLALNVTALDATAPTFLRFWPADGAQPTTANLNPTPGQPPTPNAVNVGLSSAGKFKVFNRFGNVNVVIDVVGVYVDHDHDDRYYTESEVDALVASIPEGPQGPQGPPGPAAADYENVIIVAESGGDFTSVSAAVDAIGVDADYPAASSDRRYLVWVAPGVYEGEQVTMKPFVDIEGSGQGVTVIRSVGGAGGISSTAATVIGAADAELRNLTVEIEAAAPGNWSFAIYTDANTRFREVTANATGGAHPRGMLVDNGGSPILIDVIVRADGGSAANLALDIVLATAVADGLFAVAEGGDNATGIFVNTASSEVQFENVTTIASGGASANYGFRSTASDVTLEGLRTTVTSSSTNPMGVWCNGNGRSLKILDATIFVSTDAGSGVARGAYATSCNVELRSAVLDVVTAGGDARGVQHHQATGTATPADITVSDTEIRATSASSAAFGVLLSAALGAAETFGRMTDANIRATGGTQSQNTYGIRHDAPGEVQYRGLSIIVEGQANFMYGIQAPRGTPRFDDVVIDAVGAAETTVFGVELLSNDTTLTNARVRAVNIDTGSGHDAVGVKSNGASGVEFTDVTAYAEAESVVWGADLVGSSSRLVRVDARAVSTNAAAGSALGARCLGGSAEIHDSLLWAESATSTSYGVRSDECNGTITGSELRGVGGVSNFGLYADSLSGETHTTTVVGSVLSGSTRSIWTQGAGVADVTVVDSALDGGAALASGSTVQQCTAVTHNSAGPAFEAGPVSPCP